jgi:hypothetical protein
MEADKEALKHLSESMRISLAQIGTEGSAVRVRQWRRLPLGARTSAYGNIRKQPRRNSEEGFLKDSIALDQRGRNSA